ncbi:MAG: hypothetical protein LUC86_08025 [Prevotellaceae bacterium]|nr:hypothetical protein [Prevotellaceae bacterium]
MKKTVYLAIASALVLTTSCKKLGNLTADNFKVTPTPLVTDAGEVPATITVTFPEKYMKKTASITCTPVLTYEGGEAVGNSTAYQGEKVLGNATTVNYKLGGSFSMRSDYRYTDPMIKSDLVMRFDAKLGKKVKNLPEVKIGYGVIATSQLLGRCLESDNLALAPDNFQRVISEKQEASIKFLISQSNLRTSELESVSMKDLITVLQEINDDQEGRLLDAIEVNAYASPDGSYSFNEKLAERRQNTSADYLKNELKKIKMDASINTHYTAEDWDGFQQLVEASNLQDKQLILSVLSMYDDPEERETQIRNMSEVFTDIKDGILPELRRARLIVNYEIIGRSDSQILEQFQEDASQLSVEEMVYAANIVVDDPSVKKAWNEKIIELYPNDYRAYNNMAQLCYAEGDSETAMNYLMKAKGIQDNAPEVNANLALMALRNGDVETAETSLAKGTGSSNYNEVLGCISIAKGSYAQAASQLAGTNTNTEALAEILSENYEAAANTLKNVKRPDATTAYLGAVLAARTGDTNALSACLQAVAQQDSQLAERAKVDLEFAEYAGTVSSVLQ